MILFAKSITRIVNFNEIVFAILVLKIICMIIVANSREYKVTSRQNCLLKVEIGLQMELGKIITRVLRYYSQEV